MGIAIALVAILVGILVGLSIAFGFLALFGFITACLVRKFSDKRISMWWGMLVQLLAMVFSSAINIPLLLIIQGPEVFIASDGVELFPWREMIINQAIATPGGLLGSVAALMLLVKTSLKQSLIIAALIFLIGLAINILLLLSMAGLFALAMSL